MFGKDLDHFKEVTIKASGLVDPLTGFRPSTERQLSACLAAAHNEGRLNWSKVILRSPDGSMEAGHAGFIRPTDSVHREYPLFACDDTIADQAGTRTATTVDRWGGDMSADLLFLGKDRSHITMLECKLDSEFTHRNNPPDGQVSRYLEFLAYVKKRDGRASLILVSPEFNSDWHARRLLEAANHPQSGEASTGVSVFLTTWECIFDALTSLP